jgi:predicted nucleic acid-binding protein
MVLDLPGKTWFIGPLVLGECEQDGAIPAELQRTIDNKKIALLDDSNISGTTFLHFLQVYDLGEGETECLAFGKTSDFVVCCDDRRARRMIAQELGEHRVTGSLGLMQETVKRGMLSVAEAMAAYHRMKAAGAFLPNVEPDFFHGTR